MTGKTILVVDDEAVSLQNYREAITDMGHRVLTATEPGAALRMAQEGGIDLMITDYMMPEMNGIELAAAVKKIMPETPIIMMTAYASIESYLRAHREGIIEYINKPFRLDEFQRIITAVLQRLARRSGADLTE